MTTRSSKTPYGTPSALSADGLYVATINGDFVNITQTTDGQIIRTASIHDNVKSRIRFFHWAKGASLTSASVSLSSSIIGSYCHRILCASNSHISVVDVHDESWSAEIDSGDGSHFAHVDFTASPNEIVAITEFGMQLSIFLLETGEQKIIKCPKFANPNTYSLRPGSGHLATILKIDAADLLTVHELGSYEAITTAALPTVDAQGLKWSPSGAWLAVWDAASAGTKVAIFTADGLLFRTYVMDSEMASSDFGVRCIEWSPDSSLLAVGKHDGTVDLIDGRTFTPIHTLLDPLSVKPIGRDIYIEQASTQASGTEYALAPESPVFPFTYNVPSSSRVISSISFNPSGTVVATVDSGLPHIVWLWSLSEQTPRLAGALVQKASVRQLLWYQDLPELLMTTNDDDTPSVHQWICGHVPRIAAIAQSGSGRLQASWLRAGQQSSGLIWFGTLSGYSIGYVTGTGTSTAFYRIFCLEDEYPSLSADDFPFTQ